MENSEIKLKKSNVGNNKIFELTDYIDKDNNNITSTSLTPNVQDLTSSRNISGNNSLTLSLNTSSYFSYHS